MSCLFQTGDNKEGLMDGDKCIFLFFQICVGLFRRKFFFNMIKPFEACIHYDIVQINIVDSIYRLSIVPLFYPR